LTKRGNPGHYRFTSEPTRFYFTRFGKDRRHGIWLVTLKSVDAAHSRDDVRISLSSRREHGLAFDIRVL